MTLPGSAGSMPCSKVALQVSCSNLTNKDVASKSDPCAVLSMQDRYGNWYEAGRTENVKNCLNPEFVHTFEIDYYFEEVQQLFFAVYDIDNKTEKLTDDDFLGQIQCTLAQVVASSPYVRPLVKKDGKNAGKGEIKVRAEEIGNLNDSLRLSFKAQKLDKKDLLSKSDPYLEFSRQTADGVWLKVHRTEVINNNLNPQWKPFDVKVQKLCAGNYDVLIKVDCYDYDDDGSHDFIGTFTAPCKEFLAAVDRQVEWPCINAKKQAKKSSYKNSGVIILTSCQVRKDYSFLDYVFGGMQINFTVAIDFTASNGEPNTPQSLHYINPAVSNDYQKAILAVGGVIQDYDSDKMFPALGFGAKVPPNMTVSHEFPLNFNPTSPFCAGIEGVLAAYQSCIQSVVLWGPTNFAPIIYHVAQFALAAAKEGAAKSYFVLLIITDGEITDMDNTCAAIVYASKLPMSIIIVGVGPANFSAMSTLDGDDGALKSPSGEPVARDIVQFVPFREVQQQSGAALARHVLAEVPQQLCAYCKAKSIVPGGGVQQ